MEEPKKPQTLAEFEASKPGDAPIAKPDSVLLISDLSHQITVLEEKLEQARQDIEHCKSDAIRAAAARDALKELLLEFMDH